MVGVDRRAALIVVIPTAVAPMAADAPKQAADNALLPDDPHGLPEILGRSEAKFIDEERLATAGLLALAMRDRAEPPIASSLLIPVHRAGELHAPVDRLVRSLLRTLILPLQLRLGLSRGKNPPAEPCSAGGPMPSDKPAV